MRYIWSNGCYDIIHIGHIHLFQYAKSLGDKLIVGIDSDNRIKTLKGDSRPINCEAHRKIVLESIKYIDEVVIFDSSIDLENYIQMYNIDTIVIGDDYKDKKVIGSQYANVVFFNRIPNISSSIVIDRSALAKI